MKQTIDDVQALHRAGQLDQAKRGYLTLLNDNPNDITVLHFLSILYAEEGDLESAQSQLEKAIKLQANDPILLLHLANILKAKGLFSQAMQILVDIIQAHPQFAAAYNNLGTVYFAQQKWLDAVSAYQSAIQVQADYADAYYNLGLALNKLYRHDEALNVYRALVELAPQHPGARFQLGCLLMRLNQYQAALEQFNIIVEHHPFHFETQTNLAACYLKLGDLNLAKMHYLRALEIVSDDIQTLFNLGVINNQQGDMKAAIKFYTRAVQIDPHFYEAQNNLGVAYLALQNRELALQHFQEAVRIQPNNVALHHTITILMRDKRLALSPPEYVRSLFDAYADHYDIHLKRSLRYQVPQLFYQSVQETCAVPRERWDILDLGCGTGLCGEMFKPMARSLTGVDISTKMLEVAAQKKYYDELIEADILPFLKDKQAAYDLILAGDVMVYYGELASLFAAIYRALRPSGVFVFNAEITDGKDYEMTDSGRFAQSKLYLDTLAAQFQFAVLQYHVATLRTQNDIAVSGHLYVLQK